MPYTTSTSLNANPENDSRIFNVYLSDSIEQRQAVHDAVKQNHLPHQSISDEEREAILRKHMNAQRLLEKIPVAIPYAKLVEFPPDKYRSTRDLKRFLTCIETSAFYHQFQRPRCKVDDKTYITASVADYEIAYNLARRVLIEALSDLNPSSRELLQAAAEIKKDKEQRAACGRGGNTRFTRRELAEHLEWDGYRVARAIKPLEEAGYLSANTVKNAYHYELAWDSDSQEADLEGVLTPDELKRKLIENEDSIDDIYAEGNDPGINDTDSDSS